MKVFVSKYALSSGKISEYEARSHSADGRYVFIGDHILVRVGDAAWPTREEAEQDAEKRRIAKIASLEKQLAKLRRLTFGRAP